MDSDMTCDEMIFRRREGLRERRDSENVHLVFDAQKEALHELNPTAALIFEKIDGKRTTGAIITELSAAYDVPIEELRRDVLQTIDRFRTLGIVERVDETAPGKNADSES